jgi:hypothetical protein
MSIVELFYLAGVGWCSLVLRLFWWPLRPAARPRSGTAVSIDFSDADVWAFLGVAAASACAAAVAALLLAALLACGAGHACLALSRRALPARAAALVLPSQTRRPTRRGASADASSRTGVAPCGLRLGPRQLFLACATLAAAQAGVLSAAALTLSSSFGCSTPRGCAQRAGASGRDGAALVAAAKRMGLHAEAMPTRADDGVPLALFRVRTRREGGDPAGTPRAPGGRGDAGELPSAPPHAPRPSPSAVLLLHGLEDSAWTWLAAGPHASLVPALAARGVDVWIGSNRGTALSRELWDADADADADARYWDFCLDELAALDVPAFVAAALRGSGVETLAVVGHSQGFAQALLSLALPPRAEPLPTADAARAGARGERPRAVSPGLGPSNFEFRPSGLPPGAVRLLVGLAPAARAARMATFAARHGAFVPALLRALRRAVAADTRNSPEESRPWGRAGPALPLPVYAALRRLNPALCGGTRAGTDAVGSLGRRGSASESRLCRLALWAVFGPAAHVEAARLPTLAAVFPAGASLKLLAHWAQARGGPKENERLQASENSEGTEPNRVEFEIDKRRDASPIGLRRFDHRFGATDEAQRERGARRNEELYGSREPPEYDADGAALAAHAAAGTRVALFGGDRDALVPPADVLRLARALGRAGLTASGRGAGDDGARIEKGFGHMDFTWGRAAGARVGRDVVRLVAGAAGGGGTRPEEGAAGRGRPIGPGPAEG